MQINLDKLYNHKFIYSNETKNINAGLDGTYILRKDIEDLNFYKGHYDNVVCESQRLLINDYISKLHILGFSYWGSTNEIFTIVYEDESIAYIKIPFIDWVSKSVVNYQTISLYGEAIKTIKQVKSKGTLKHTVNFHESITTISNNKKVKEIIFPDNFLIHIFKIKIEV